MLGSRLGGGAMRGHDNVGGRGELWLDEKFKESEEMVGWGGIKSLRRSGRGRFWRKERLERRVDAGMSRFRKKKKAFRRKKREQ